MVDLVSALCYQEYSPAIVYIIFLQGATSIAQTSGGGGTSSDMPWRDKDEDYLHWARRAMRYAHAKHYPGNKLKKSKSY